MFCLQNLTVSPLSLNSDPLAIPIKKGEMSLMMKSRKANLKGEYCVEGELSKLSKSETLFIYAYVLGILCFFLWV